MSLNRPSPNPDATAEGVTAHSGLSRINFAATSQKIDAQSKPIPPNASSAKSENGHITQRAHPIKIAQLGPTHPFKGGIVHFNSRLAQELLGRNDCQVSQFFWTKPYPEMLLPAPPAKWLDTESRKTFEVRGSHILSFSNPLTWFRLAKRIRRQQFDFLITHWVHPVQFLALFPFFLILKILTKTKIILITHNILPHERFFGSGIFLKIISLFTKKLVIHSSSEILKAEKINLPKNKILSSFHPIYDIFFEEKKYDTDKNYLPNGDKIFLFFGFIRPYKGIEILLDAFKIIQNKHKNISLFIVGENFNQKNSAIAKKINSFSDNSKIFFIDQYIPNEDVGHYFHMADVVVLPYLEATQSGPLQIAYAFDKPVIASDLPAFRDCVENGISGYLFKPGDSEGLAQAMLMFLEKPLNQQDVRSVRRRFNWDKYVQILLDGAG